VSYRDLLRDQLRGVYDTLARDGAVSPRRRFRAEGVASAGRRCGLIDDTELVAEIAAAHEAALALDFEARQGQAPGDCLGEDGDVSLPVVTERAPVVPSTRDD
jgi:hypothetical protein